MAIGLSSGTCHDGAAVLQEDRHIGCPLLQFIQEDFTVFRGMCISISLSSSNCFLSIVAMESSGRTFMNCTFHGTQIWGSYQIWLGSKMKKVLLQSL